MCRSRFRKTLLQCEHVTAALIEKFERASATTRNTGQGVFRDNNRQAGLLLEQTIEVSPVSGLSNVRFWLREHGYDSEDDALCDAVFALAKRSDHTLTRQEIEDEIAEMLRVQLDAAFPNTELEVERDGPVYKIHGDLSLGQA